MGTMSLPWEEKRQHELSEGIKRKLSKPSLRNPKPYKITFSWKLADKEKQACQPPRQDKVPQASCLI